MRKIVEPFVERREVRLVGGDGVWRLDGVLNFDDVTQSGDGIFAQELAQPQ
jgi:hypothetical protein